MKRYSVYITYEAKKDVDAVYYYIAEDLMLPMTADNYYGGILYTIRHLATTAGIYAISQSEYIQSLYGSETRTVRYKKMIIIYNIVGNRVIVRRVIAGSLIR